MSMKKFELKESIVDELSTTPEARLLQAILLKAVDDAMFGYSNEQKSALFFLWSKSNQLRDLCLLFSHYDIHYVRKMILNKIKDKDLIKFIDMNYGH